MSNPPLLIEFITRTRLRREPAFSTGLPIVGNGPPGTFVIFSDGREVPLPTDQIIVDQCVEGDAERGARVAFGGMRCDGIEGGELVFRRVKDLLPEAQLSPERGRRMTLEPWMVAAIFVDGAPVWPPRPSLH